MGIQVDESEPPRYRQDGSYIGIHRTPEKAIPRPLDSAAEHISDQAHPVQLGYYYRPGSPNDVFAVSYRCTKHESAAVWKAGPREDDIDSL